MSAASLAMEDDRHTLVGAASWGNKPVIDKLLERYLPALRTYVRLRSDPLLRSHESCSDIVQSVCTDVLEHVQDVDYRGRDKFKAWLLRKAMFKIVDRVRYLTRRKRDVRREVPLSGQDFRRMHADSARPHGLAVTGPPQAAIHHETMERLEAAFDQLSEEQHRVLLMSRLLGMSHRAIAESMDKTPLAVRALLHRAIKRLGRIIS